MVTGGGGTNPSSHLAFTLTIILLVDLKCPINLILKVHAYGLREEAGVCAHAENIPPFRVRETLLVVLYAFLLSTRSSA